MVVMHVAFSVSFQQTLQSGLHFPTMTWTQPVGGYGLDQTRLEVFLKVKDLR